MADLELHTRETFDEADALNRAESEMPPTPINLVSQCHGNTPFLASYKDGVLRLLCSSCGFEAFRIAVGSSATPQQEESQSGS